MSVEYLGFCACRHNPLPMHVPGQHFYAHAGEAQTPLPDVCRHCRPGKTEAEAKIVQNLGKKRAR